MLFSSIEIRFVSSKTDRICEICGKIVQYSSFVSSFSNVIFSIYLLMQPDASATGTAVTDGVLPSVDAAEVIDGLPPSSSNPAAVNDLTAIPIVGHSSAFDNGIKLNFPPSPLFLNTHFFNASTVCDFPHLFPWISFFSITNNFKCEIPPLLFPSNFAHYN